MFITELSIKRPTVSWVMSLILIIFGLFVFWKLPVRELPDGIQPPVVQVQVDYKSASASIVDQEVTQVVEDVIGGAEGIKNIDSKSENGRSTINVEFDTSIDLDNAANDIRERVARVVDNLPTESDPPQILKRAAGFTTTMWLSLSSSSWSDLELGDYAERYLVDQFSSVKNVGRIRVGGLRELSIRVWIDPIKLAANDLTIKEVEFAIRGENVSLPAGTLEADNVDLTLNLDKSYNDIDTIKQIPIKKTSNRVIQLSDVANVEFGPVSEKTLFKAQTKDQINLKTVGIGIYARSGASTVELSNDIKKKIVEVKKTLPEELDLRVSFNRANYVEAAIEEVYKTLVIAFILVVLIIYLFLGNLKAVIVPAIALPVSLIASFLGLYIFGLSINIFVLLSFILAIGIITDDSVIMTDAIYRRIENGETPLVAAYKGSKQISFAIVATTLILVAVFLPLIFIEGISGTLTSVANVAGKVDKQGKVQDINKAMLSDSVGTVAGAMMGTTTVTSYVESGAGVKAGGKTGMTSLVIGILFLACIFFAPLATSLPKQIDGAALLFVSVLFIRNITDIEWNDISESAPAILAMIAMPLTYSISNGIALAFVSYALIKIFTGKFTSTSPAIWVVAILSVVSFAVS